MGPHTTPAHSVLMDRQGPHKGKGAVAKVSLIQNERAREWPVLIASG